MDYPESPDPDWTDYPAHAPHGGQATERGECSDPEAALLVERLAEVYGDALTNLDGRGLDQFAAAETAEHDAFRQALRAERGPRTPRR